jgi:hypothetical protein
VPRSVAITGAAAGIGRATALRFAREGWLVGAYDIDLDGLASLATEVEALAGELVTGTLDVRDAVSWQAALEGFVAVSGGSLDVLVNNAGIIQIGRFADLPLDRLPGAAAAQGLAHSRRRRGVGLCRRDQRPRPPRWSPSRRRDQGARPARSLRSHPELGQPSVQPADLDLIDAS